MLCKVLWIFLLLCQEGSTQNCPRPADINSIWNSFDLNITNVIGNGGSHEMKISLYSRQDGKNRTKVIRHLQLWHKCSSNGLTEELIDNNGANKIKFAREELDEYANGASFQNLTACQNYYYGLSFQLKETGKSLMLYKEGILTIPPEDKIEPKVKVANQGKSFAEIEITGGDENCLQHIPANYVITCTNSYINLNVLSSSSKLTGLLPDKRYQCEANIVYLFGSAGGVQSPKKNFTIKMPNIRYRFFPEGRTIRLDADKADLEDPNYVASVQVFDAGTLTKQVHATEAVKENGVGVLPAYQTFRVCLVYQANSETSNSGDEMQFCQNITTNEAFPENPPVLNNDATDISSTGFRVTWTKPDNINGKLKGYSVKIEGKCKVLHQACPCSDPTTREIVIRTTNFKFESLNAYWSYKVQVNVGNTVGSSSWSNEVTIDTLSGNEIQDFEVIPFKRSFTVLVVPKCPYTGPIQIDYYRRMNKYSPEKKHRYDLESHNKSEHEINPVELDNYDPFKRYNMCILISPLPQRLNATEHCKLAYTLEDCPEDVPIIRLAYDAISHDTFIAVITPPKTPNGNITHYEAIIDKKCLYRDSNCNADCDTYTTDGKKTIISNGKNQAQHTFDNLDPYTSYQVSIVAHNSECESNRSTPLTITTRPILPNIEFDFTPSSGNSYINVNVQPLCPYVGAIKYTFTLGRRRESIFYDPPTGHFNRSISFADLKNGQKYEICMTVESVNEDPKCEYQCSSPKICKIANTECKEIPTPTKLPENVEWSASAHSDFNPLSSVKLRVLKNTFDGSQSGINSYGIQSNPSSSPVKVSGEGNYESDFYLILSGLEPSTEYTTSVTAIGCNNTKAQTGSIKVKTMDFKIAKVEMETAKFQHKLTGLTASDEELMTWAVFKLSESQVNIKYGDITEYKIGETVFEVKDGMPTDCLTSPETKENDDAGDCYILAKYKTGETKIIFSVKTQQQRYYQSEIDVGGGGGGLGLIVTGMVFSVLILILASAIFVFWRKKQIRRRTLESGNPMVPIRQKRDSDTQQPLTDSRNRNMALRDLVSWVSESNFNPTDEYKAIDDLDQRFILMHQSKTEAKRWSDRTNRNGNMNRYGNILPYDTKRVVLKRRINDCDYVNASWVRGFANFRFIASQGPLAHTSPHFWQMVHDNDVRLIVMLTKLKETRPDGNGANSGRVIGKCHQYWPTVNESLELPEIGLRIDNTDEQPHEEMDELVVRKLILQQMNGNSPAIQVTQLHYMGWPDHGVPESTDDLLDLHRIVRQKQGDSRNPVVVHCSAGVGRTGTLIGLDTLSREVDDGAEAIDVFNVVYRMREDRGLMVQKPVQYKYLYQCIAAYIRSKEERGVNATGDGDYYYY